MEKENISKIAKYSLAALIFAASSASYATKEVNLEKIDSPALKQTIESVVKDHKLKVGQDGEYLIAGPCGFWAYARDG